MPTRTPRIPDAALARIPGKAQYRLATQGAEVVVGGDHPSLVLPEAHASKWGGECWLRVRHADADDIDRADKASKASGKALKAAEKASLRTEKGKPVLDIPTPGKGRRHEIREGSLKWDVVYDSPAALPADGIERFQLEFPAGLTWHYQPELTPEEIAEGAERPENVVGSYAGYFDKAGRYLDKNGEEIANYETGKFAHLYRPEMVDASGNRCWADQVLVGNRLQVTLPVEWMATAVYPVRLDPTFGYASAGASTVISGNVRGSEYALSVSGNVSSITAYWTSQASQTGSINYAIYDSSNDLVDHVGSTDISTLSWLSSAHSALYTISFGSQVALTSGNYSLVAFAGVTTNGRCLSYDSVSSKRYYLGSSSTTPPDPFNGTFGTAYFRYSIYATYEESGGGANTQVATSPGTLTVSGSAPSSAFSGAVTSAPGGGALTITPPAAEILFSGAITSAPEPGLLDLTGHPSQSAFSGAVTSATLPGSLAFSGLAGQIIVSGAATVTVLTAAGALSLTGAAPSAAYSGTVRAQTLPGLLALAGVAPGLMHSGAVTVELLAGELSIDGQAVETTIGGGIRVETAAGLLSLLGNAPSVVISGGVRVETQPGAMALTGAAPVMIHSGLIEIVTAAGVLGLDGRPSVVQVRDASLVVYPELFSAISRINTQFEASSRINTQFEGSSRVDLRRLN
ncbi:MAG: hypothetical protein AB7E55_00935 [Pigmentiphaga sp.]